MAYSLVAVLLSGGLPPAPDAIVPVERLNEVVLD